jgi:hypothetical protein
LTAVSTRGIALVVAGVLAVFGCKNVPDTYAPPIQRKPSFGADTERLKHFVAMGDEDAPMHFMQDIHSSLEGGSWRWTGQRPTVRLFLRSIKSLRLVVEFFIPDAVIQQTGPLTVRYVVNGHAVDSVRYDSPGQKRFEKPVDASWLVADADNVVSAELDKVYIAEADKAKLGLALNGIGFLD